MEQPNMYSRKRISVIFVSLFIVGMITAICALKFFQSKAKMNIACLLQTTENDGRSFSLTNLPYQGSFLRMNITNFTNEDRSVKYLLPHLSGPDGRPLKFVSATVLQSRPAPASARIVIAANAVTQIRVDPYGYDKPRNEYVIGMYSVYFTVYLDD